MEYFIHVNRSWPVLPAAAAPIPSTERTREDFFLGLLKKPQHHQTPQTSTDSLALSGRERRGAGKAAGLAERGEGLQPRIPGLAHTQQPRSLSCSSSLTTNVGRAATWLYPPAPGSSSDPGVAKDRCHRVASVTCRAIDPSKRPLPTDKDPPQTLQ